MPVPPSANGSRIGFESARPTPAVLVLWLAAAILLALAGGVQQANAQQPAPAQAKSDEPDRNFANAMQQPATKKGEASGEEPLKKQEHEINLLEMASPEVGGIFMYPIYAFSFVVLLYSIERMFALRRRKILPDKLVDAFGNLAASEKGFDPRKAYRLCQQYPSTASNVIRATLLKIGRPHSEVEHAVEQANELEAAKLYTNVRPLNLAASAAPLLGLLGTVQGMIMAFFATAHLPDGANKATVLAQGVYVALITTFAGLCVAIPAVCASHYLEGKIQKLFREIDELVYNLLPQLERYEGKLRVNRQQLSGSSETADGKTMEKSRSVAASTES